MQSQRKDLFSQASVLGLLFAQPTAISTHTHTWTYSSRPLANVRSAAEIYVTTQSRGQG